jgi:hypothetical protein
MNYFLLTSLIGLFFSLAALRFLLFLFVAVKLAINFVLTFFLNKCVDVLRYAV